MLKPALDRSEGKFHVDHVFDLCAEGKMQLWVAWKHSHHDCSVGAGLLELLAVMVTEIVEFPGKKVLSIPFLAGDDMDSWLPLYPQIEAWAKEQGCEEMEILGRKGWERVTAPLGFRYSYTALTKEI